MRRFLICISVPVLITGCGVSKSSFSAEKKYSASQLRHDYDLYEEILEAHHPGLYWYTPKDSMDYYFRWGREHITDSMNEQSFRNILNYVTSKIDCGHTSVRPSKAWGRFIDTAALKKIFPLSIKAWKDTLVVTSNLNRNDSILTRGTVVTRINDMPVSLLFDSLFRYMPTDGYNLTHKYQTLSNRGYFGSLYTAIYGRSDHYRVEYRDDAGVLHTISVPAYNPVRDTGFRRRMRPVRPEPKPSKRERKQQRLNNIRLLKIDTVNKTAMMDLSSFGRGYGLKRFYRRSFRELHKQGITHLVIDVRSNGGGSVTNSTTISRYMADKPFKVADTLFAIRKKGGYYRYIQNHCWNKLFIALFTRKKKDGHYHFGYFERHYFKPKTGNHFSGKVYILTGGNSFSATTLFTEALIRQDNVTVIGEETGGGAYGNSAWLIPDVTLPETGVRFRLPLFRLVIDKDVPKNGRGIQPEIYAGPSVEAIRQNRDFKLEKALELIEQDKKSGN